MQTSLSPPFSSLCWTVSCPGISLSLLAVGATSTLFKSTSSSPRRFCLSSSLPDLQAVLSLSHSVHLFVSPCVCIFLSMLTILFPVPLVEKWLFDSGSTFLATPVGAQGACIHTPHLCFVIDHHNFYYFVDLFLLKGIWREFFLILIKGLNTEGIVSCKVCTAPCALYCGLNKTDLTW